MPAKPPVYTLLEVRLRRLLEAYAHLEVQNRELREENAALRETVKQQATDLKALVRKREGGSGLLVDKGKLLKLVESTSAGATGSAELKERLDEFIQELNTCIAHLGGP